MSVFDTDDPALPQLHCPKHMEASDPIFFAPLDLGECPRNDVCMADDQIISDLKTSSKMS